MRFGVNWPVVYVINNDEEAYVGETVDAANRSSQHLQNEERRRLRQISVISDSTFNISVIMDLESFLIQHMSSDGKFRLQNSNRGLASHNYYQREDYEKTFGKIWQQLHSRELVDHSIADIENSELFKYSPYKALTSEQYDVLLQLLHLLAEQSERDQTAAQKRSSAQEGGQPTSLDMDKGEACAAQRGMTMLVSGSAGTGKTVLAVYLMKLLHENLQPTDIDTTGNLTETGNISALLDQIHLKKVGLVIPQQSLRSTLHQVFRSIKDVSGKMILSPSEAAGQQFDLLIVDEAHRLRRRKALAQYLAFDNNNTKLGLGKEGTELDWILCSSRNQILFYDSSQSVKPADIPKARFEQLRRQTGTVSVTLRTQLRCEGGEAYIDYVKSILDDQVEIKRQAVSNYEFKLFDHVEDMVQAIKEKDQHYGLCRTVAGFAWRWVTKPTNKKKLKEKGKPVPDYDIEIEGHRYIWNTTDKDWVNSANAVNEIGCIHTVQGYDLNYAGVIFGNEIGYDQETKTFRIDKSNYHDHIGKTALDSDEQLKEYILNIYATLMTRGIRGTYLYACDEGLREYLKGYAETWKGMDKEDE
jgi:DUF2075 family protein